MSPLRGLSLPVLCRAGGHTCAACCHGERVPRRRLERVLARQTALFGWLIGPSRPGFCRLLLFEVLARGLSGLAWAVLLLLPLLGDCLAWWLRRRAVCSFLGFEDAGRSRVGCLLHPSRHAGRDDRQRAAFALWRGFGCGAGDWLCDPARRFALADWRARRAFLQRADGLDWFSYERAAAESWPAPAGRTPRANRPDHNPHRPG